jgi:hypothetical protein
MRSILIVFAPLAAAGKRRREPKAAVKATVKAVTRTFATKEVIKVAGLPITRNELFQ